MRKAHVDKQKTLELLETRCRQRGLPVTVQRRVILDVLLDRDDHPTVDQMFADVKDRIPGVSRTTVYRALETLVDLGLAKRTNHFEAAARFDGNTDHHHHLICQGCNRVIDFDDPALDKLRLPDLSHMGFRVFDCSVYFEGLCSKCGKKGSKSVSRKKSRVPDTKANP